MPPDQKYDFIITGAGCAGLSLLTRMIASGQFSHKKILLLDKEEKNKNDRTWCFWETSPGFFESLVYKKWQQAWFHSDAFSRLLSLPPYTYKLIRGFDFYEYCLSIIRQQKNITVLTAEVKQVVSDEKETFVLVNGQKIQAGFIFNSILFDQPLLKKNEYHLLQHFKGWVIETEKPVFNPEEAILMDFRVDQQHGTTFVYVMPFSPTKALVEYTLFTSQLLGSKEYDEGLQEYIRQFIFTGNYKITEKEYGVIPMTNYRFVTKQGNIFHTGTAGGQTKASSGYTFQFIQKQSASIVENLINTGKPFYKNRPGRFHFYDSVLLHILYHRNKMGKRIFTDLFKKNKPQSVLRFLDNESSLKEEFKIISSLPTMPFLKAAIKLASSG